MFTRRTFLRSTAVATVAAVPLIRTPGASAMGKLPVVADGTAHATVWLAPDADDQTKHSAAELIKWISEATGVELPQRTLGSEPPTQPALIVGAVVAGDISAEEIERLGHDGFIQRRADNRVTIVGVNAYGTRFGVYDFLERHLDIRWVMPDDVIDGVDGVDGADVPQRSRLTLDKVSAKSSATFASRVLLPFPAGLKWDDSFGTPWRQSQLDSWGHYARMNRTIATHHNLWSVIPPAKYADPGSPDYHPEFFPLRDGERFLPAPDARTGWQPDFGAPGLVDVAVSEIMAQLDEDPELTTYSLVVNDGQGFSDDDLDTDNLNHFLMPNASEAYYAFVNAVVEQVAAHKPDITFSVLAYVQVADPPSFPLHPAVLPYLTCDTSRWANPTMKEYDQAWARTWSQRVTRLGWWNYSYGGRYQVPRLFLGDLAEAYRFMADIGVVGLLSEWGPGWGEGPKPWVMSRLYWDPHTNVTAAINEWARHAVGQEASVHIRRYYQIWERFWSEVVPSGEWFAASARIWAAFGSADYLEQLTEAEVRSAGEHLSEAAAYPMTEAQRSRLEALQRYQEYYEANVASYPRRVDRPATAEKARELLDTTAAELDRRIAAARRRIELAATLVPEPALGLWSGWNLYAVWEVAEYLRAHEPDGGGPVTERVQALLSHESVNVAQMAQLILDLNSERRIELGQNTSFDNADTAPWSIPSDATTRLTGEVAHTPGGQSLLLEPLFSGAIEQSVAVRPGFYRFGYHIFVPESEAPLFGWYAQVQTRVFDAAGEQIQRIVRRFAHQPAIGKWYEIHYADFLSAGATTALVRIVIEANHKVYLDDVAITQVPESDIGDTWTAVLTDRFSDETVGTTPSTFTEVTPDRAVLTADAGGEYGLVAQLTGVGERTEVESGLRGFDPVRGVVKVSFDFRKDTGRVGTTIGLVDADGEVIALVGQSSRGDLRFSDGGTSRLSGAHVVDGQWYQIDLLLRPARGGYELHLDGTLLASAALNTTTGPVAGVLLRSNAGYFDMEPALSIDNLTVSVPAS